MLRPTWPSSCVTFLEVRKLLCSFRLIPCAVPCMSWSIPLWQAVLPCVPTVLHSLRCGNCYAHFVSFLVRFHFSLVLPLCYIPWGAEIAMLISSHSLCGSISRLCCLCVTFLEVRKLLCSFRLIPCAIPFLACVASVLLWHLSFIIFFILLLYYFCIWNRVTK
jgi:hypothetical protein